MGSLSIWHWLIVLLVVVLIFGTKKLRNMGGDVGGAVKEFKNAMNEGKATETPEADASKTSATAGVVKSVAKPKATAKKPTAAKAKTPAKAVTKVPAKKTTVAKTTAKKPTTAKAQTATKVAAK